MDNSRILYLIENVDKQAILKILTLNNTLVKDAAELSYYDKLATWANNQKEKIKNINLDTIELSDRSLIGNGIPVKTNSLLGMLNELNNKLSPNSKKFDANSETAKKVQQLTVEILTSLSKTKKKENPVKVSDWTAEKARRLKEEDGTPSEILSRFYDDYYSQVFAKVNSPEEDTRGILDKLKSLNKVLIVEFNKLGYNPEVNPFAQFLKNLIEHKFEIFKKLTTNNYGAIHNSYIDRNITGNMLGNYNNKSILFCTDLYNQSGSEIMDYLSLQNQVLTEAKNNTTYSNNPELLLAKIFIKQKLLAVNYKENINKLLELGAKNVVLPNNNGAELRSISEISEMYQYIFGTTTKKYLNFDAIVDRAKAENVVLDMIHYLLNQDDYVKAFSKDAQEIEEWLIDKDYRRNDRGIKISREILANYTIKDATDKCKLIKQLSTDYDKNNKTKAEKS